jgi:hypothetical protein
MLEVHMSVSQFESWDAARAAWQAHLPCPNAEANGGLCVCRYAYPCPSCATQIEAMGEDMDGLQELEGRCAKCYMAAQDGGVAEPSGESAGTNPEDDSWVDDLFGKG